MAETKAPKLSYSASGFCSTSDSASTHTGSRLLLCCCHGDTKGMFDVELKKEVTSQCLLTALLARRGFNSAFPRPPRPADSTCVTGKVYNHKNRLFMAPHLVRAQSVYKDIRMRS